MASTASPSGTPGRRLKEMVTGGKKALVIHRQRRGAGSDMRDGAQGNLVPLGDFT